MSLASGGSSPEDSEGIIILDEGDAAPGTPVQDVLGEIVVELDEASWFAVEVVTDAAVGGTVDTCDSTTWTCTEAATALTQPMAVAINETGPFVVVSALIPGETAVVPLA